MTGYDWPSHCCLIQYMISVVIIQSYAHLGTASP
jgi:hypothetical protein